MEPHVEIVEGTAFEVLLGAAAVADANWREVFATGQTTYVLTLAALGPEFVRRVAAFGRFGWINLIGLLTRAPRPWDLDGLVEEVRRSAPEDLHFVAIGGDRRQLLAMVDESLVRNALAGDAGDRATLSGAFASDRHVLDVAPWLLETGSVDVHRATLDILQSWRDTLLPRDVESAKTAALHEQALAAQARLRDTTSRGFLDQTIGGLHYDPAGLDRVLTVSSPSVTPVVVVVDGRARTVIVHPPLARDAADGSSRLLELSRAIGDKTRIAMLTMLRSGEMTAIDLAHELGAPRTTLLHHLAILRAAGVIHVTVTPGDATIYRLRPEGFSELATSAARFIPTE